MELRPSLKMGKSKCARSPISYLTTAPPEFETFKLLLMACRSSHPAYVMRKFQQGSSEEIFYLNIATGEVGAALETSCGLCDFMVLQY